MSKQKIRINALNHPEFRKWMVLAGITAAMLLVLGTVLEKSVAAAADSALGSEVALGHLLPVWSVSPFVGMLLSIALLPLFKPHFWEKNMGKVSVFWALLFMAPFSLLYGNQTAIYKALHIYMLDYLPFIILLIGLFCVSGGIVIRGTLSGTPLVNTSILIVGTFLASWIGTTGAAMLLIRPLLRSLKNRKWKAHTVVFFIFLVCNIGGSLTPIGDPPLFLGFLHGVPFFWTMRLILPMGFNVLVLVALYLIIDRILFKREPAVESKEETRPLQIDGLGNLIFLAGIVGAVIVSGSINHHPLFFDSLTGETLGIRICKYQGHYLILPWVNILRDTFILLMAGLSLKYTPKYLRRDNLFTWGPMREVAILFAGIFATMIPALEILQARGGEFGITTAAQFFWVTGALSSFLDNAPTYLTFLSLVGGLGAQTGVPTDLGIVSPSLLMAISCGAVFMGANTYIGNAPNFMVRSIAEENGVKMPSFFGYMGWSVIILIPLFILNTVLFF